MHLKHVSTYLLALVSIIGPNCVSATDQTVLGQAEGGFDSIRRALVKADIIDEVLDDFKPQCFVVPFYGKKRPVALGNIFKQSKTKERPSMKIYCPKIKSTPGLIISLTDPDAPSRDNPKWSEVCHWIGIIPTTGNQQQELELTVTNNDWEHELMEYKPPGPPPKTGYHRYVFVLLQGDIANLTAPSKRYHWGTGKDRHGVRNWAKEQGLEVIGANYFIEKNKKQ
ncbi:hypothetical protein G7Y89_g8570 [Cudoniella acicularis]|uniref:Carboxypeptidase Y inhibitor n=1 Tax=Cudoniella acicularis TaxID=354080 RepID=A0A8H4RJ50_9HELO|nr:hypothetical protein G7Y89_g8570 [Cudoniella acicularis]